MHAVNLAAIDLNLLIAFDALIKDGAVTTAGTRIGLSQPAMSHALRRLRALFGDPLFVRTSTGMQPTPRARALAAELMPALDQIGRAIGPAGGFEPTSCERAFTVGMSEYAEIALVKQLAGALHHQAPRADLRIVPMNKTDYVARLDAGELDVAVGHLVEPPHRLLRTPLYADPLVCVGRRRHPAFSRRLTVLRYARLLHILVSPTGEAHGPIDRLLATHGQRRRVALVVGTYLALPVVLRDSDLVATLPARAARALAEVSGLAVRQVPLVSAARVAMVWHRRDDGDPAHAWFRALIARVAT